MGLKDIPEYHQLKEAGQSLIDRTRAARALRHKFTKRELEKSKRKSVFVEEVTFPVETVLGEARVTLKSYLGPCGALWAEKTYKVPAVPNKMGVKLVMDMLDNIAEANLKRIHAEKIAGGTVGDDRATLKIVVDMLREIVEECIQDTGLSHPHRNTLDKAIQMLHAYEVSQKQYIKEEVEDG